MERNVFEQEVQSDAAENKRKPTCLAITARELRESIGEDRPDDSSSESEKNIYPPKSLMAPKTIKAPIPIGTRMSFWVMFMKAQRNHAPSEPQAMMSKPVKESAKKEA